MTGWKKWIPKEGLQDKYYVDKIIDDIEKNLMIELSDRNGNKMILNWNGVVISYTCSEETTRSILYDNNELTKWTFFEVEDSRYLQWVCEQSLGIYQINTMRHFCIIGIDLVVDIVADFEPIVN